MSVFEGVYIYIYNWWLIAANPSVIISYARNCHCPNWWSPSVHLTWTQIWFHRFHLKKMSLMDLQCHFHKSSIQKINSHFPIHWHLGSMNQLRMINRHPSLQVCLGSSSQFCGFQRKEFPPQCVHWNVFFGQKNRKIPSRAGCPPLRLVGFF